MVLWFIMVEEVVKSAHSDKRKMLIKRCNVIFINKSKNLYIARMVTD